MTTERWAFSTAELLRPELCTNEDELVAFVPASEIGVLVYRNGKVSNRYADGTTGVPADIAELADGIESLGHPVDDDYADLQETNCWKDVVVNDDGSFQAFADRAIVL